MNRLKVRSVPGIKSDWEKLKEIDKKLLEAFEVKDFEKVDKLISKGANVNVRFGQIKDSALHFFDDIDIVTKLLDCGANVSASNRYHESALIYACKFRRHKDVINLLLSHGAYVNKQIKFGRMKMIPLTVALENMNDDIDLEIIENLVYYGANVDFGKMFTSTPFITALTSSPELARKMIKYSLLRVWDKYRYLRMGCEERRRLVANINWHHLPYFEECMAEILRLKEELFDSYHSLYDICRGGICFNMYIEPYPSFQRLYKAGAFLSKYPIYGDALHRKFDFIRRKRLKLLIDLDGVRVTSKIQKNKNKKLKRLVPLHADCFRHVAQFLSNYDIECVLRAAK